MIDLNVRSNASTSSSASTLRANSRKRSYCCLSSTLRTGGFLVTFRVVLVFVAAIKRKPQSTGSLYGASSQNGLGGSWFRGGFSTSRSIGQPLADDGADRALSTLYIIDPESDSVAVAEIEFGKVAMQMGLADVEIAAV